MSIQKGEWDEEVDGWREKSTSPPSPPFPFFQIRGVGSTTGRSTTILERGIKGLAY